MRALQSLLAASLLAAGPEVAAEAASPFSEPPRPPRRARGVQGNAWCFEPGSRLAAEQVRSRERCCGRAAGRAEEPSGPCWGLGMPENMEYDLELSRGIFTRNKCCHWNATETGFEGFVHPLEYLLETSPSRDAYSERLLNSMSMQLPAFPALRMFPLSMAEVPAQVAWEVERFQRHGDRFESTVAARSQVYGQGGSPCRALTNQEMFLDNVAELQAKLGRPLKRFINIGANDGLVGDPVWQLYSAVRGQPGALDVAFELDPKNCAAHRENIPEATLLCSPVTPATVWKLLGRALPAEASPVLHVDMLKVDIDSFDCAVVEALLGGGGRRLRPRLVMLEVNDAIPPPFRYALGFEPGALRRNVSLESITCQGNIPVFGCSLAYQVRQMRGHGFGLVHFWFGNAVFADEATMEDLRRSGLQAPLDEFDCYWRSFISAHCQSGRRIRRWLYEIPEWEAYREIWAYLQGMVKRFDLPPLPMVLEL